MRRIELGENTLLANRVETPAQLLDRSCIASRARVQQSAGYGSGSAAVLIHNTTSHLLTLAETATDAQWGLRPAQTVRPHQRSLHLIMRSVHRPHRVTLNYQVSMMPPGKVPLAQIQIDCMLPIQAAADYALNVMHSQSARRLVVRQHVLNDYTVAFTLCEIRF